VGQPFLRPQTGGAGIHTLLAGRTTRTATSILLFAMVVFAAERKPIPFSGRVEGVDHKLWTVAVRHGDIPGFMPAMTMDYPVHDATLLKHLSVGDALQQSFMSEIRPCTMYR
jgi:Cu/Ag efflux protein CusF